MADHAGNLGLPTDANLTPETLNKVQPTRPQLPPPTKVADAVVPVLVAAKGGNGVGRIADETPDGVRVQTEHEGDEEVVRVPEGLEALLSDAVVRGRVHEHHAQEHGVARHTARLLVVDIEGESGAELGSLDVVEAALPGLAPRGFPSLGGGKRRGLWGSHCPPGSERGVAYLT